MNKQCANRIGSVPYLNSVPLTFGIEKETSFVVPSELAELIRAGKVDAALVSTTEVLFHDGYEVLDSVAITSHGPVKSVFLAHRQPLEEIQTIHCDTASLTSVNLLRVLLTKRGLEPTFVPLTDYTQSTALDNVLIIGNHGIDFLRAPYDHAIWDLGAAWHELTGLPFVYAVWALRRGHHDETLRAKLLAAKENGLANLAQIITEHPDYDSEFRKAYLSDHIRYDLGGLEKAGLNKFVELLETQSDKPVFEPAFV